MLKTRVSTGIGIAAIMVVVLWFSYIPWVLNIVAACLSVRSIFELFRAVNLKPCRPLYYFSFITAVVLSCIPVPCAEHVVASLLIAAIILFTYLMINIRTLNTISTWITVFVAICMVCFFKCLYPIRAMENGVYLLGLAVLVPIATDIFAYFIGRTCGKHKLAPVISPRKTVEGSFGGTIATVILLVIVAVISNRFQWISIPYGALILYSILASLVGQFGDLALSAIKRIVGIKDYGALLPGHGGILDRFDSLLFVLPFSYLFFQQINVITRF